MVAVFVPPRGVRTFEGVLEGSIAYRPAGDAGFGYDPIFLVPEYGRTLAELGPDVKNRISHRAQAVRAAKSYLSTLTTGS